MSAKILFAKKRAGETRAHSIVVGDAGFYWRELPGEAELSAALQAERFSLIIVDHEDLAEDPLAYVELLRGSQTATPVLVVSEQLALENVVRAIRVGVKDLFHPPIDLAAIVERIYSVLKPELGASRGARLDEWRELTVQFADRATIPPLVGVERRSGPPRRAADAAQASQAAAELQTVRAALAEALGRQQELEREIARLAANQAVEAGGEQGLVAERAKLAAEQQLIAQLARKFEAEAAAWKAAEGTARADLARREAALAEKTRECAAARENLEVELILMSESQAKLAQERAGAVDAQAARKETAAKLRQLVVEQSALTKAREKLERDQLVWQSTRATAETELAAKAAGERQELEALRVKLQLQTQELANWESGLQHAATQTKQQATQTEQAQAQLQAEQATLAAAKAAIEQETSTLTERVRVFETKQRQVREQMQQLLAVS